MTILLCLGILNKLELLTSTGIGKYPKLDNTLWVGGQVVVLFTVVQNNFILEVTILLLLVTFFVVQSSAHHGKLHLQNPLLSTRISILFTN